MYTCIYRLTAWLFCLVAWLAAWLFCLVLSHKFEVYMTEATGATGATVACEHLAARGVTML